MLEAKKRMVAPPQSSSMRVFSAIPRSLIELINTKHNPNNVAEAGKIWVETQIFSFSAIRLFPPQISSILQLSAPFVKQAAGGHPYTIAAYRITKSGSRRITNKFRHGLFDHPFDQRKMRPWAQTKTSPQEGLQRRLESSFNMETRLLDSQQCSPVDRFYANDFNSLH